jgi:hypothetical protein
LAENFPDLAEIVEKLAPLSFNNTMDGEHLEAPSTHVGRRKSRSLWSRSKPS